MPRVHMEFKQTRTATGRLSSAKPRSGAVSGGRSYIQGQNIPVRTVDGKRIRGGFVAREGCLLGSWDLNQIEMRVMAHVTQDANLLALFREGAVCPMRVGGGSCVCHDIHRLTASLTWGVPINEVTSEQRSSAKNLGFGMIYGITAKGLRDQFALRGIDIDEPGAQALIDRYLREAYPGIMRFWEEKFVEARRFGYVRSESGRIRWVSAVRSSAPWVREEALRQAANQPIQEFAGWLLKQVQKRVWERVLPALWRRGYYVECVLPIHDELIFEFEEGLEDVLDPMVRYAMTHAVKLDVPVECEGHWGKRWSSLKG